MEVMRDKNDNAVIICAMKNMDQWEYTQGIV